MAELVEAPDSNHARMGPWKAVLVLACLVAALVYLVVTPPGLLGKLDGEFAGRAQTYAGTGTVQMSW